MPSRWILVALLAFVPCLGAPTCGAERGDESEGAPCTRTADCQVDLVCIAGVCRMPRHDAGPGDAGPNDGAASPSDGAVPDAP